MACESAIYEALKAHALYRLTLVAGEPDHERQLLTYQLDVVCDTGRAITPRLALSAEALMALQRREFRMPRPKVVGLEGMARRKLLRVEALLGPWPCRCAGRSATAVHHGRSTSAQRART